MFTIFTLTNQKSRFILFDRGLQTDESVNLTYFDEGLKDGNKARHIETENNETGLPKDLTEPSKELKKYCQNPTQTPTQNNSV